ncbi:hypothetical protein E4U42_006777, partial [Claviceps africana]
MLKKVLVLAGAVAAASLPSVNTATPRAASSSKVLMSTGNTILVADFDGAGFSIASQTNVSMSATWLAYAKPDRLFAVDEAGSDTALLGIDVAAGRVEAKPRARAQGSSGV